MHGNRRTRLHSAFVFVAAGGADTAVAHLARLTSNCVACHAAYRLEAR